jgi:hypothetical protein
MCVYEVQQHADPGLVRLEQEMIRLRQLYGDDLDEICKQLEEIVRDDEALMVAVYRYWIERHLEN